MRETKTESQSESEIERLGREDSGKDRMKVKIENNAIRLATIKSSNNRVDFIHMVH